MYVYMVHVPVRVKVRHRGSEAIRVNSSAQPDSEFSQPKWLKRSITLFVKITLVVFRTAKIIP